MTRDGKQTRSAMHSECARLRTWIHTIWPGRWPLGPASCRVLSAASGWIAERSAAAVAIRSRPATSRACRSQAIWSIGAYLIPSVPADCEQTAEDSRLIPLRWCSTFFVDWDRLHGGRGPSITTGTKHIHRIPRFLHAHPPCFSCVTFHFVLIHQHEYANLSSVFSLLR